MVYIRSKISAYKKNERLKNKRFVSLSSKLRTSIATLKTVRGDRKQILYFLDEAAAEKNGGRQKTLGRTVQN